MMQPPTIHRNRADALQIEAHLRACNRAFVPPLSHRVDILAYSRKIHALAERFEAWSDGGLIALLAMYCNDSTRRAAYITSVSVDARWKRLGLASDLLAGSIALAKEREFEMIELEVDPGAAAAYLLYQKHGFAPSNDAGSDQNKLRLAI